MAVQVGNVQAEGEVVRAMGSQGAEGVKHKDGSIKEGVEAV